MPLLPSLNFPILSNELFGWLWVLVGMFSGAVLGMRFQRADFLGGYASRPRRLIRLGHISFFGLGILNVLFALSLPRALEPLGQMWAAIASWSFVVGGVTMPACCALCAWRERAQPLFVIPVVSLTFAVEILLVGLVLA